MEFHIAPRNFSSTNYSHVRQVAGYGREGFPGTRRVDETFTGDDDVDSSLPSFYFPMSVSKILCDVRRGILEKSKVVLYSVVKKE